MGFDLTASELTDIGSPAGAAGFSPHDGGAGSAAGGSAGAADAAADVVADAATDAIEVDGCTTGCVAVGPYGSWRRWRVLNFDTTPAGADVSGNVQNFPLLLRLDSAVFAPGFAVRSELRFADSDGTALPYEIEMWDDANQVAAVWVLVPQVDGNSSADSITMFWDNPGAQDESSGPAVFANGDVGVWHLAETGDVLADSAGAPNPGTNQDTVSVAGLAGNARLFDSSLLTAVRVEDHAELDVEGAITISAWVKPRSLDVGPAFSGVLSKGDPSSNAYSLHYALDPADSLPNLVVRLDPTRQQVFASPRVELGVGSYQHVAITLEPAEALVRFYLNGSEHATVPTAQVPVGNAFPLHIGLEGDDDHFDGEIDETRVSAVARSADYLKLSFESQRIGQTLVR